MKILYAANNSSSSRLQHERFLDGRPKHSNTFSVRSAVYNNANSSHYADYTLDSFTDYYGSRRTNCVEKAVVNQYVEEIATYKPDLIINDFNFYTAYAACELGIPYWLVSSSLLHFGIEDSVRKEIRLGKHFRHLLKKHKSFVYPKYQIANADRLLVYSCLGDMAMRPNLAFGYEWVRPYHIKALPSDEPAGFVAPMMATDKPLIKLLSELGDTYLYSNSEYESYPNVVHRHYSDDRYSGNLENCYLVFNRGESSFVADAFYAGKHSMVYPDVHSLDTVLSAYYMEHFGLAERIYTRKDFEQINNLSQKTMGFRVSMNPDTKFLHQYIEETKKCT